LKVDQAVINIFSAENKEISAPPPCGFPIGIYLLCENWSTETLKLSEREGQRSGLIVPPTYLHSEIIPGAEDY
jgi:hypothetical protein